MVLAARKPRSVQSLSAPPLRLCGTLAPSVLQLDKYKGFTKEMLWYAGPQRTAARRTGAAD